MPFRRLALLLVLCACAAPKPRPAPAAMAPAAPPPPRSLYQRLGGQPAVEAVAGRLVDAILRDGRVNVDFAMADVPRFRRRLTEFVCAATGGPCKYEGRDMRRAHAGLHVTSAQFDAVVEDLSGVLAALDVPARERHELLAALAPLRPQIVEVP